MLDEEEFVASWSDSNMPRSRAHVENEIAAARREGREDLAEACEVIRGLLDHLLSDHAGRSRVAIARDFLKRVEGK